MTEEIRPKIILKGENINPVFNICLKKWLLENIEESFKYLNTSLESHSWKCIVEITEWHMRIKITQIKIIFFSFNRSDFLNLSKTNSKFNKSIIFKIT